MMQPTKIWGLHKMQAGIGCRGDACQLSPGCENGRCLFAWSYLRAFELPIDHVEGHI